MFAIVKIAGQQFKVEKDQEIFVHRLEGNAGDKIEFSDVLVVSDEGNLSVGADLKKTIKAAIVDHVKGDKTIAFKMKRRKGFRKKIGFRQSFTKIKIEEIV
jgi:large subunit ribosomal protein L21